MAWERTSTAGGLPPDPVGEALAEALAEVLVGASVELAYAPSGSPAALPPSETGWAAATGTGPPGWDTTVIVRLDDRVARLLAIDGRRSLAELLDALPVAGIRAAARVRNHHDGEHVSVSPAFRRALRDTLAAEILAGYLVSRVGSHARVDVVAETIEFLIELSGTRVEAHDLTHGVIVADVLHDTPASSSGIRPTSALPSGRRCCSTASDQCSSSTRKAEPAPRCNVTASTVSLATRRPRRTAATAG